MVKNHQKHVEELHLHYSIMMFCYPGDKNL